MGKYVKDEKKGPDFYTIAIVVILLAMAALVVWSLFSAFTAGGNGNGEITLANLSSVPAGSIGDASAPVTVIEYSDFQCQFCREWALASKDQLVQEYVNAGKVRFEFKDFPLPVHPMAPFYATAARCAGEQGKYFEMHDKIYDEQDKISGGQAILVDSVTQEDVKKWATEVGLDSTQFNACLDLGKYGAAMQENKNEGALVGVQGTPSFVIGKTNGTGTLLVGNQSYSAFKDKIDSLLSN